MVAEDAGVLITLEVTYRENMLQNARKVNSSSVFHNKVSVMK